MNSSIAECYDAFVQHASVRVYDIRLHRRRGFVEFLKLVEHKRDVIDICRLAHIHVGQAFHIAFQILDRLCACQVFRHLLLSRRSLERVATPYLEKKVSLCRDVE